VWRIQHTREGVAEGTRFAWRRRNRVLRHSCADGFGCAPGFGSPAPTTIDAFRHEPAMIRVS
jgi:hypothetical protein